MADQIVGFRVRIDGSGNVSADDAWEEWTGGGSAIEERCSTSGTALEQTCSEIVLRGPMVTQRKAMLQWINDTVSGRPWQRNLTITELVKVRGVVREGKQYLYYDCFPTGYIFPRMDVTNTTGNVMEEVRIKPLRCELK